MLSLDQSRRARFRMRMDPLIKEGPRLVVIPSDPVAAYEQKGTSSWLEAYYNPQKMFHEVFAISPREKGERTAYGMTILGVQEREFSRIMRNIRPDVVRAYGGFWPADLACRHRIPGVPVVVSVHDTNPSLLHRSVRYADLVICMSKAVEKQVLAMGVDPSRIRILPNRIDTNVFYPIKDEDSLQSVACRFPAGKNILHVGRKSEQKNLDTLIRALEFLPVCYSCVFIGMGNRSPYVALAEQLGVCDRCFWVDSVENSQLPLWYSWCDCMCTPSRGEGFGLVFIEAAACGAPIVTSDIPPMNEYLTKDVSACLVRDYENPRALAAAVVRVCEDSEYRRSISNGAVEAAKPFDRRIVDLAEVGMYREALNMGRLSLLRRGELFIWRTQGVATSLASLASPKRVARAIRRSGKKKQIEYMSDCIERFFAGRR